MNVSDVSGTLAVVASIAFVWPQVVRLVRTRDVDGVSALSAAWACSAYSLWTAYGLRNDLLAVIVANAQLAVGFATVVVLLVRFRAPTGRLLPVLPLFASAVVAISVLGPPELPGIVAVFVGGSAFLPQAYVAITQDDLSGVSVPTYLLIATASTLWLFYGAAESDPIVIATSVLIVPVALVVAARAHRSHRGGDRAEPLDTSPSGLVSPAVVHPEPVHPEIVASATEGAT